MFTSLNEFITPISIVWHYKILTLGGVQLGLGNIILALILLIYANRLSNKVAGMIDRRFIQTFIEDQSSRHTYNTFLFYAALGGFVTLSMAVAGIPLTVFTVFGGALAIGVGFGSQNIVNNFISGIILMVERPIKVGDIVELDGISGNVLSIGTRSTQVKNFDGKIFVVPNSFFLEKSVLNWSLDNPIVRTSLSFGVAYGSDVKLVENICLDILLNTPGVLQEPMPLVIFENFSESTLDFQLLFWCSLEGDTPMGVIRSQIRFKINDKFKELGIQMAFPQRDLNIKLEKPLDVKVHS